MRRFLLLLALLLIAATPDETKLLRVAETAFNDRLYDFAERQLKEFLEKHPQSDRANDARLMLAQAQVGQGKWREAVGTLDSGGPTAQPLLDGFRLWKAEALALGEEYSVAARLYGELAQQSPNGPYRAQAQYGLAYVQFKQHQYPAAATTLAEVGRLPGRDKVALEAELLRGQILLAQDKFAEAEAVFEPVVKRDKDSRPGLRAQRWRGEVAARHGDYDKARKRYSDVIESWKAEPNKNVDAQLAGEAWAGLGWVEWQQEQFEAAIEAFAQALTLAREPWLRRESMLKLGESYVRAGRLAQGVARLKDFLKEHPKDRLAEDVQLAIANLFYSAGDFGAALTEYKELVARYPQSKLVAQAQSQAGWCEVKQNRLAEALPYFEEAFTTAADTGAAAADPVLAAEAIFKMADLQFQLGRFADAVGSYQQLNSRFPSSALAERALFQLGQVYQRMQNAEAAIHVYDELVDQFPKSAFGPEAKFQIGLIHVATGDEAKAREAFGKVVDRFAETPWAARARLAIGESFYREAKYDQAVAAFDKLIASAPDTDMAQRAIYNRGWCYYAQGQPDKTLMEFNDFLTKYKQSTLAPDVQFWIGDYYARQKNYIKAQEQFQAIAKSYPATVRAADGLYMAGRAAYSRQDFKTAIDLFETLVKNYTNSAWRCDARYWQGDAFTDLNQYEDALLVFESLIKQFPDCYLVCEAQGRRGDCQFTLKRYDDAIASFGEALNCAREAEPALRNQLRFKRGLALEKAGKLDDAFADYTKVIYENGLWPDPNVPPEKFWLSKCGLAAAGLKEQQQQWREAITLYGRLAELCPDMKDLLDERIRKLRVEHFILF